MVDKQFIQHILLLSIRAILEYPPHLAVQKSWFSYMASLAVCPAIRMAYRLAHGEPMLDITVQELCDYRRQRNKKHDANDAEQLSAQQGGQQRPQW